MTALEPGLDLLAGADRDISEVANGCTAVTDTDVGCRCLARSDAVDKVLNVRKISESFVFRRQRDHGTILDQRVRNINPLQDVRRTRDNATRKEWWAKLRERGFSVPTILHPTAHVSRFATIGEGT